MEPPMMVINTILSMMTYNYSLENNVYMSDDAGSDLTFFTLLEASRYPRAIFPFNTKIIAIGPQENYHGRFKSDDIAAAFLELNYALSLDSTILSTKNPNSLN
ncbi:hypothetical protein U1Q18_013677 [Sarracenia purpurea var. burkii]